MQQQDCHSRSFRALFLPIPSDKPVMLPRQPGNAAASVFHLRAAPIMGNVCNYVQEDDDDESNGEAFKDA